MGGGYAWHKSTCFTCKECNKRLDTTTLCERENEIYCKSKFIINLLFFLNEKNIPKSIMKFSNFFFSFYRLLCQTLWPKILWSWSYNGTNRGNCNR